MRKNLHPMNAPPNTMYNQKLYALVKPSGFMTRRAKAPEEGGWATICSLFLRQRN